MNRPRPVAPRQMGERKFLFKWRQQSRRFRRRSEEAVRRSGKVSCSLESGATRQMRLVADDQIHVHSFQKTRSSGNHTVLASGNGQAIYDRSHLEISEVPMV